METQAFNRICQQIQFFDNETDIQLRRDFPKCLLLNNIISWEKFEEVDQIYNIFNVEHIGIGIRKTYILLLRDNDKNFIRVWCPSSLSEALKKNVYPRYVRPRGSVIDLV